MSRAGEPGSSSPFFLAGIAVIVPSAILGVVAARMLRTDA